MICSSHLKILNHLLSKGSCIFILLWVLQIMKPMVPSYFSTLPVATEGSSVLSSHSAFHLEGFEWYCSQSVFHINHPRGHTLDFYPSAIPEWHSCRGWQGNICKQFYSKYLFLLFSQAHSTCAHKPIEKKKHSHAYISCEQRLFRPRHCYISPTVLVTNLFNSCCAMKCCSCLHLSSPVDDRWELESPGAPWCPSVPWLTKRHPQEWAAGMLDWLWVPLTPPQLCYSESCLILLIY